MTTTATSPSATPGELYNPQLRRTYQNAAVTGNIALALIGFIVTGQLMQLYATDVLHYDAVQINLILSLLPLGHLVRFAMLHFSRRFTRIHVVTVTCSIRLLALALILLVPADHFSFASYLAVILLFNYFGVVADVYWQPLLREITTIDDRGSFFARMRFWFHVVGSASIGLITLFVGKQVTQGQYKLAVILAVLGVANFLFWSFRLPNLHPPRDTDTTHSPLHLYRVAFTSPLLRRPLIINLIINFAAIPGLVVYQRQLLHIPANVITATALISNIGAAVGLMFWGRVADRIGYRPLINGMLILTILLTPLFLLVAPFPTTDYTWSTLPFAAMLTVGVLMFINFFDGCLQSGLGIGMTTLQHYHVHHHETVEAMNLLALANSLSVSLSAIWTGYLIKDIALPQGDQPILGLLHLDAVKLYMLAGLLALRLLAMVLTAQLPNSRPNMPLSTFFRSLVPFTKNRHDDGRATL